jgi:hypothetical protein
MYFETLAWVRKGQVCDAYAQKVLRIGVADGAIVVPTNNFGVPSE